MPYTADSPNLPTNVKKLDADGRARWAAIWNDVFERTGNEGTAFVAANGSIQTAEDPMLFYTRGQPRDPNGRFAGGGGPAAKLEGEGGGFTISTETGIQPKKGFSVSPYQDREAVFDRAVTNDDIKAYREKNADLLARPGHYLGGWRDEESGKRYLDVSVIVKTKADADALSRQEHQEAYYDLESGETTYVHARTAGERLLPQGGGAGQDDGRGAATVPRPLEFLEDIDLDDDDPWGFAEVLDDEDWTVTRLLAFAEWFGYTITEAPESTSGYSVTSPSGTKLGGFIANTIIKGWKANPEGKLKPAAQKKKAGGGGKAAAKSPEEKKAEAEAKKQAKAAEQKASADEAAERTLRGILPDAMEASSKGQVQSATVKGMVDSARDALQKAKDATEVKRIMADLKTNIAIYKTEATKTPPVGQQLRSTINTMVAKLPDPRVLAGTSYDATAIGGVVDAYRQRIQSATSQAEAQRLVQELRNAVSLEKVSQAKAKAAARAAKKSAEEWADWYLRGALDALEEEPRPFYSRDQLRAENGRWTAGGGGGTAVVERGYVSFPGGRGIEGPAGVEPEFGVEFVSGRDAAMQLGSGGISKIRVHPEEVPEMLRVCAERKITGNLERVDVSGRENLNMFQAHLREMPRTAMPQLPETIKSCAQLNAYLTANGVHWKKEVVDPRKLLATQNQLDPFKVGVISQSVLRGKPPGLRPGTVLLVSREGAVIDGHHRWAAVAGAKIGNPEVRNVHVYRYDKSIDEMLALTNAWKGVEHEGIGAAVESGAGRRSERMTMAEEDSGLVDKNPYEDELPKGGKWLSPGEGTPTSPPPDENEPWMWADGEWVLIATDSEAADRRDGIPS